MAGLTVTTVYDFGMKKYLLIQMHNKDGAAIPPIRIQADKFERQGDRMIISLSGQQVGEFNPTSIAGWWFEEGA